jgi:hypothetical protein
LTKCQNDFFFISFSIKWTMISCNVWWLFWICWRSFLDYAIMWNFEPKKKLVCMHLLEVEYNQFLSSWGSLKLVWREVGDSVMKKIEVGFTLFVIVLTIVPFLCSLSPLLDIMFNLTFFIMFILLSCFCLHIFCISCHIDLQIVQVFLRFQCFV